MRAEDPSPPAPDLSALLTGHDPSREILGGWTSERAAAWLAARARRLRGAVQPDEVVALVLGNRPEGVLHLLSLLQVGARCLVLAPETTEAETRRLLDGMGGGRILTGDSQEAELAGAAHVVSAECGPQMLLPTSGSTGLPTIVQRSVASLMAEGHRYVSGLALSSRDRVLLIAPIAHAYALGWLVAALVAGAETTLVPSTYLDSAVRSMAAGTDWVVLTPTLARLLARRRLPAGLPAFGAMRVVCGAGPVDGTLEAAFRARFGCGLWRNYGSTETGAVLMGGPGLPDGCVGTPLPGVQVRLADAGNAADASVGRLQLSFGDGEWRDTGDLATIGADGLVTLKGRTSLSVRRGERWISPAEVERVIAAQAGVRACRAFARRAERGDEDGLIVEVWPDVPTGFDAAALFSALRQRMPSSHLPDEVRVRGAMARGPTGKIIAAPRYCVGDAETLLAAARAYKRSELLFSLAELGVLDALDGVSTVDTLAERLGLDVVALQTALEQAERFGLVSQTAAGGNHPRPLPSAFIDMERCISTELMTRTRLARVLRSGVGSPPEAAVATLRPLYADALHGDAIRFRVQLGIRRAAIAPMQRLLEITAGPGNYLAEAIARWPSCEGRLWQVGALAHSLHGGLAAAVVDGRVTVGMPSAGERYDVCVVFNAIHLPEVAGCLPRVIGALAQGGTFLIDDLFLGHDPSSAELGLDWLTHGGISFQTEHELKDRLIGLGVSAEIMEVPRSVHARHLIGHLEATNEGG